MSDTRSNELIPPGTIPREHDWFTIRRFIAFISAILLMILLFSWFYAKVIVPIAISVFLAYLITPLVDDLERRKINRSFASVLILALFLGGVGLAIFKLGPFLYDQLVGLIKLIPALVDSLSKNGINTLKDWAHKLGMANVSALDRAIKGFNFAEQAVTRSQAAIEGIWVTGANIMGSIVSLILIPFVTFFLILEKPYLIQTMRRVTPRDIRPYFKQMTSALDSTMKAVVRGHLKVALTLVALYSIGFSMIGLSAGAAIGIVAGICRLIPYLDAVVGTTLGVTYVFASGMPAVTTFAVVGVVAAVQVLDGAIITPKLIGGRVGLHPAVVILTVIAFGNRMGFWGVLIAIPFAAVVKTLVKLALPVYRDSRWFRAISGASRNA